MGGQPGHADQEDPRNIGGYRRRPIEQGRHQAKGKLDQVHINNYDEGCVPIGQLLGGDIGNRVSEGRAEHRQGGDIDSLGAGPEDDQDTAKSKHDGDDAALVQLLAKEYYRQHRAPNGDREFQPEHGRQGLQ